jgi:hypothetical protein
VKEIPSEILAQHVAVLGKTGSGKTSTAKLAIEQVVAKGARVCILDPIKSDWWGLTSSANGKHAGLPFHILGGPHGHVPLHSAAGKAIADVVATGALPLSIVDMADFEPGGQAKFFVDFAPMLLRKMRGVVYLVIEEAHLFAPKERSGIGAENLSIHWAKTMATAGRSKGVRLVLVTQRTQALHNALLGSCDTLIAHRLTAPADQEPVVKWLKANTSKEVLDVVAGSLASLRTGEGWICSGEAKLFERVSFPRISTYDNTATPTGDAVTREVKTAPVDPDKLRAIIGQAVEQAKADDPRELRKQVAQLQKEIATLRAAAPTVETKTVEKFLLKDGQLARAEALVERLKAEGDRHLQVVERVQALDEKLGEAAHDIAQAILQTRAPQRDIPASTRREFEARAHAEQRRPTPTPRAHGEVSGPVSPVGQRILNAVAELEQLGARQPARELVALLAGYTHLNSKGFVNAMGTLSSAGLVSYPSGGAVALTDAGRVQADPPEAPRSPREVQERICNLLGGASAKILQPLIEAYPKALPRGDVAAAAGYGHLNSKGFVNAIGRLRSLGFVDYPDKGTVVAQPVLFLQ